MTNIKKVGSNLLIIGKKSYKNINIQLRFKYWYWYLYITMKDHLNVHSVNSLYLAFNQLDG